MDKALLLSALKKKPVPIKVNDVTLHLRPMSVAQKEAFALWRKDNPNGGGVVGRLIAASLCDEAGNLLLATPEEANDLDGGPADLLCNRIIELNGLGAPEPGKESSPTGNP